MKAERGGGREGWARGGRGDGFRCAGTAGLQMKKGGSWQTEDRDGGDDE